jgi:hypothetical protein
MEFWNGFVEAWKDFIEFLFAYQTGYICFIFLLVVLFLAIPASLGLYFAREKNEQNENRIAKH